MKQLIISFVLVLSFNTSYTQTSKEIPKANNLIINNRIEQLEKENNNLKEEIKEFKQIIVKQVDDNKSDTKDLINIYIISFTAFLTILGFLINFFGKKAIKDRVEELVSEAAKIHIEAKIHEVLNSKVTEELIENAFKNKAEVEIKETLKILEHKGTTAIDAITQKGFEAINSLKSQSRVEIKSNENNQTDKDIQESNLKETSNELFEIAYNSKEPRIQIELYESVLKIEPDNIAALNNIGVAFNSLTRPTEAIDYLSKAINLDPQYYQALTNRAQSYNLNGELEKALIDIEKSLSINSNFEYSYAVKGNILTKLSRFSEAEIELNKAIELNENSGEAYFNRAFFYEERKEFLKSENDYLMAEKLGVVNKAMLFNNLAVLHRRIKKYDLAINYLDKARQISPEFSNIDGTLALIYADKGDDENFYKYLKIALEKGCKAWDYLSDSGFDKYRETIRLKSLIEPYRKKYFA
jgi:tetratricopeptide (TPR) repeat protein